VIVPLSHVAERIQLARQYRGLTQGALAEQLVRTLLAGAGATLPQHAPEPRPNGPLDVGGERSGWSASWPEKAEARTAQEAAQQPQEGASPAVDLPRFVRLTKRVREAQRAYFKTRDATVLAQSKALEGKLDQWIDLLAPENKKQSSLFKDKT